MKQKRFNNTASLCCSSIHTHSYIGEQVHTLLKSIKALWGTDKHVKLTCRTDKIQNVWKFCNMVYLIETNRPRLNKFMVKFFCKFTAVFSTYSNVEK